jgi:uncharacterized protein YdeI (YjbR/CyaY-like superfamily)
VKVPYAKKWQKEADKLRKIVLDCDLIKEIKWGKPCFTYQKKNVAIVIPLKDACAFSFFKGALLNDPKHILQRIGHAQAGRWIKFTSVEEITAMQSILRNYIYEAIEVEESGKKVTFKKVSEYAVPEELQARLDAAPELRRAFEELTPGRRKSYIFYVSGAKQVKTRAARAERCVPMILCGRGLTSGQIEPEPHCEQEQSNRPLSFGACTNENPIRLKRPERFRTRLLVHLIRKPLECTPAGRRLTRLYVSCLLPF